MFHAFRALGRSRRIHGRISAADDHNVLSDIKIPVFCLEVRKELKCIDRLAFFQSEHPRFIGSHSKDNRRVSCIFQHIQIRDLAVQTDVDANLFKKRRVFVNGTSGDTELRDHVAHHASKGIRFLKQCSLHA